LEPQVLERFAAAGIAAQAIQFERDRFVFDFKGPPAELVDTNLQFYGPTMKAFEAAAQQGCEKELRGELVALFANQNQSGEAGRTVIPATYLKVSVDVA
jgi:hypothetical protein